MFKLATLNAPPSMPFYSRKAGTYKTHQCYMNMYLRGQALWCDWHEILSTSAEKSACHLMGRNMHNEAQILPGLGAEWC